VDQDGPEPRHCRFPGSQDTNGSYVTVTAVPEPATLVLLATAGLAALTGRQKPTPAFTTNPPDPPSQPTPPGGRPTGAAFISLTHRVKTSSS
jgi:PEP-CTERM putative exosortase interaction domain